MPTELKNLEQVECDIGTVLAEDPDARTPSFRTALSSAYCHSQSLPYTPVATWIGTYQLISSALSWQPVAGPPGVVDTDLLDLVPLPCAR